MGERSFRNAKPPGALLVGYKLAADLAGKGVVFVLTIAAARRLTASAFGLFSLASTLGWMLAVAADFGIQLHLARRVARRPEEAAAALARWLPGRGWTTAAAVATVMLGLVITQARVATAVPLLLFALLYGCSGLVEFLHYYYRGLSRSDVESSLILAQRVATLVFGLVALAWRPSVTALAVALLVPMAARLVVSLRVARRLAGTEGPGLHATADAQLPSPDSFARDVLPIGAGIVLSALYFRIDVFLVEWWRGTEAVALYNAVFRLVEAFRLLPAAVLAVALPDLCRARDRAPLVRLAAGVSAVAAAATVVCWTAADVLIPLLFGRAYVAAVPTFRILVLAFPLLSLNYALTHQLVAWNGERAYAVVCALALAVNIGLNATLIPSLAIDGAAWATVATEMFLTVGCLCALASRHAAPATEPAPEGLAA